MLYFTVPLARFLSCQTQMQMVQVKGRSFRHTHLPTSSSLCGGENGKYLQSGVETLDHTGLRQVLSSGPNFLSLP